MSEHSNCARHIDAPRPLKDPLCERPGDQSIALDASWMARASRGDVEGTADVIQRAVEHRGFALVDVLQPCVSFNKLNSYAWFREHTYPLGDDHDPADRAAAFRRAVEDERLPLGVFYVNPGKPIFEEQLEAYRDSPEPVTARSLDRRDKLAALLAFLRE
jgi:2-oxoglutarate ferredoxin oxidoreductase subunit beta